MVRLFHGVCVWHGRRQSFAPMITFFCLAWSGYTETDASNPINWAKAEYHSLHANMINHIVLLPLALTAIQLLAWRGGWFTLDTDGLAHLRKRLAAWHADRGTAAHDDDK